MRLLLVFFLNLLFILNGVAFAGQNTKYPFIAGGTNHSLIVSDTGTVRGVGNNYQSQLGGDKQGDNNFVDINDIPPVSCVAVGDSFSLICDKNGDVWVFGNNNRGQLGMGDDKAQKEPQKNPYLKDVIFVSAGSNFSLALDMHGNVWGFGDNSGSQLTIRLQDNNFSIPQKLSGLPPIIAIAAAQQHSLALDTDGYVWGFGDNRFKQIGGNDLIIRSPTKIDGLKNIVAIAAGSTFSLALDDEGRVWSVGNNNSGQLGHGDTQERAIPEIIPNLEHITQISAGGSHALAVDEDGLVWGFGSNSSGQLGLHVAQTSRPTVLPVGHVRAAVASAGGSFFVDETNQLWVMGNNSFGELGLTVKENQSDEEDDGENEIGINTPVKIPWENFYPAWNQPLKSGKSLLKIK